MALCNLIGCQQHHDAIDAIPQLAKKTASNCFAASILALIYDQVKVLIETNISNKLNFLMFIKMWTTLGWQQSF